ncbi:vitamin D3 hydroxylase-associated protein-like [Physella acuta]|uniref:vitamin D3 hydroxylase-associated protein-like n=1 Tax=Physella acuta TaxID=109671 RepID=UPI0027DBA818|nr:vitamin D3 hydroxylase-associated protein-like [Physella acuta]
MGTAGLSTLYAGVQLYKRRKIKDRALSRAEKTRQNLESLKKKLLLLKEQEEITQLSFSQLFQKLQTGQLKVLDVLHSYQIKAITENERINAITDIIQLSESIAEKLDTYSNTSTYVKPLLYGIPISVKESCGLEGEDCTAGFSALVDKAKVEDSVLIKVLKLQGAIPFIRTNLPQGMRSFSCTNPVYGETRNPLSTSRSPGGSSGGEGAIIGAGGSVLGVGSDIGGSIRIPASFCGVCALKPTSGRLSSVGNFGTTTIGGQQLIRGTDGPMGRDVTSLVHFMKSVLGKEMFTLDPTVPPIPFNDKVFESKEPLRIGYYVYDGCTHCVPAVERAVLIAKTVLHNLGHTLIEIQPYKPFYAFSELFVPALFGDDCESYRDLLAHESPGQEMHTIYQLCQLPYFVRWTMSKLKEFTSFDPMNECVVKRRPIRSLTDWFRKTVECKTYQLEFNTEWIKQKVDAVICPCMPCVAPQIGIEKDLFGRLNSSISVIFLEQHPFRTLSYTSLYNVVNYPAGTLPVTKVTASDVAKTMSSTFYKPETNIEKLIQEDSDGTEGLPVGIQIVARPYQEEVVLRVMLDLETALRMH